MNDTPKRQESSEAPDSSGSGRKPLPPLDDARGSGDTHIVERGTLDIPPSEASSGVQRKAPSPATSAFNPWDPAPGMVLGGYRLDVKLGEGGMGAVWKARHLKLDKDVAIKLLSTRQAPSRAAADRFEREMKAVGKLEHPHLVRAYDAGEASGVKYLVMEFIDGVDLAHHVKTKGPLPLDKALRIIERAARGLAAAHEAGLVHRDIKPANLMVDKRGQLKITDLGLARLAGDESDEGSPLTATGAVLGTPDYMSPEQWEETHTVDARCDLYALGCTLFFLVTGEAPYADRRTTMQKMQAHVMVPPPDISVTLAERSARSSQAVEGTRTLSSSLATPVPESVAAMYRKLVAKKPEDRYGSARELIEALGPILAELAAPKAVAAEVTPSSPTVMDSGFAEFSRIASEVKLAVQSPAASAAPPRSRAGLPKWVWGAAAAAVVLFGVVVIIKRPDGTTQKIKLKPGEKVEIVTEEDDPPTKPGTTKPSPSTKPAPGTDLVDAEDTADDQEVHRRALRAILAAGGTAGVRLATGEQRNLAGRQAQVPDGPFVLCEVVCQNLEKWDDRGMATLRAVPSLRKVLAAGTSVTDAGWEAWPTQSRLESVDLAFSKCGPRTLAALARIPTLSEINSPGGPLDEADLTGMANLPRLHLLTGIYPTSGLKPLAGKISLTHLDVQSAEGSPVDWTVLGANPRLTTLWIWNRPLDVSAMNSLAGIPALRVLRLQLCDIPADALAAFRKRRPDVVVGHPSVKADESVRQGVRWALDQGATINAFRADGERPDQVPQGMFFPQDLVSPAENPLSSGFENLRAFRGVQAVTLFNLEQADLCTAELGRLDSLSSLVMDARTLTASGLRSLWKLPSLHTLSLSGTPAAFGTGGWDGVEQCAGLQTLFLGGVPLRDDDLAKIARCTQLGTLYLSSGSPLTAAGLKHLQALPWLTELNAIHVPLGDSEDVIAALADLKGLRVLQVQGTGLSAASVEKLHAALPHCAIFHDGGMVVPKRLGGASAKPAPPPPPAPQPEVVPADHLDTADDQEVHRRAVRAILAAGGRAWVMPATGETVELSPTKPELPSGPFVLIAVGCQGARTWDDRGLKTLRSIPTLRSLGVNGTSGTDAGWEGWPEESCLDSLDVGGTGVGERTAKVLARIPTLSGLDWSPDAALGEDELAAFARLPCLQRLRGLSPKAGLQPVTTSVSLTELSVFPGRTAPLDAAALSNMARLSRLAVWGGTVDGAALESLAGLRALQLLELQTNDFAPDALSGFRKRRPDVLVHHPSVTADDTVRRAVRWALDQGAMIPAYRAEGENQDQVPQGMFVPQNLLFTGPKLVSSGFEHLQAFRGANNVHFSQLENADLCVAELARLGTIVDLYLDSRTLTAKGLRSLWGLPSLKNLNFTGYPKSFGEGGWDGIEQCVGLQTLGIGGIPLRDDDLAKIARCSQLGTLSVMSNAPITAAGLRHLQSLRWLTYLRLESVLVGDGEDVVAALSELKRLRFLRIINTGLSAASIEKLHTALPHCAIFHDGGMVVPKRLGGASAKPAPPPPPAPQPEVVPEDHLDTADDQEVHRRAVRAILAAGGEAHVLLASGKIVNLNPTNAELPTEPFVLFTVSCYGKTDWGDRGMRTLWSIPTLRTLGTNGTSMTDAGWEGWPAESRLESASVDDTRVGMGAAKALGRIPTLTRVDWVRQLPTGPDELAGLARLPRLRILNGCTPSLGLGPLAESVPLRSLSVYPKDATRLDGDSLSKLPHLLRLFVVGGTVDAAALEALAESKSLRQVAFRTNNLSLEALAAFRQRRPDVFVSEPALPADEAVRVGVRWALAHGASIYAERAEGEGRDQVPQGKFVPQILNLGTGEIPVSSGFEHLQAFRPLANFGTSNLRNADLCAAELARLGTVEDVHFDVRTLTGQGFRSLFSNPSLSGLILGGVPAAPDRDCWDGIEQCEGLQVLQCAQVPVRDDDLAKFARCRQLGTLALAGGSPISAAGLRHLQPLQLLTELGLGGVPVGDGDEVVAALSELKGLRFLHIQNTGLSAASVAKLQTALPHCAIFHDGGMVFPKRLGGAGKSGAK